MAAADEPSADNGAYPHQNISGSDRSGTDEIAKNGASEVFGHPENLQWPKKPGVATAPEEQGPQRPASPTVESPVTASKKLREHAPELSISETEHNKCVFRAQAEGGSASGPEETRVHPDTSAVFAATPELDEFGLPIRKTGVIQYASDSLEKGLSSPGDQNPGKETTDLPKSGDGGGTSLQASNASQGKQDSQDGSEKDVDDSEQSPPAHKTGTAPASRIDTEGVEKEPQTPMPPRERTFSGASLASKPDSHVGSDAKLAQRYTKDFAKEHAREASVASSAGIANNLSEFSHQKLSTEKEEQPSNDDGGWQAMPAFAPYDIYDDDNRLIAREHVETEEDSYGYAGLGGAGKGYTRVLVDDDAESATSMDENTQYLFKEPGSTSIMEDEEQQRDTVSQMQATKNLLTEGQRIAYVGITRLHLSNMIKAAESIEATKHRTRRDLRIAAESMRMWSQKMMIRLYAHMDISLDEQVMIEQLSYHGVEPKDLTPALMANSRVSNPMAGNRDSISSVPSTKAPQSPSAPLSPRSADDDADEEVTKPPPPYEEHQGEELPAVRTPSQMPTTEKIDIDLRWTVLCDLFLVLIADSVYDARSRVLLEIVGQSLDVPWIDICKFEKKVTEALEMQQNAEKENWDEKDHMEVRRKMALKRRYVMMGLATVGGGLVIGLSAGLLAPVIGAGLAAGFTTIGVTGTSSFLAGAGGAAIITSSAAASGSVIGGRAAERRTGAVKTFEYRPLHNNKRVNLIVTVSGWMTGKVDDVRLPYSTVDPVMGDIYSVLWEPEMLTSMGDTINILATEALTQGLQQVLGSTILVSLMAALQLPVVLTKLSYLIDNPWAVSLDRATMAGLILADSIVDRNLGTRPITLVGYSLGSRLIYSCLLELARKGAYGLVQNVFLFGSPIVVKRDEYLRARTVVAGRFVNGYNRNDWILGYLFRLTSGGIRRVAGLGPVEGVPGMENMDVTEFVVGHMDYRTAMPRLLRECGWLVESDEFTEIEDPDPDNHAQRQRELINEIEEARKELEKESKTKKGGAFSFFSRKKKGEKQEWEIYEEAAAARRAKGTKTEDAEGNNHGVLFDVDAIRAELAKEGDVKEEDLLLEQLQVRELESTLPPMKLDVANASGPGLPLPAPAPVTARSSIRSPFRTPIRSPRGSLTDLGVDETSVSMRLSHEHRASSASFDSYRLPEERTPTMPTRMSLANGAQPYGSHMMGTDDGISMVFDSSFDEGPSRTAETITSSPAPYSAHSASAAAPAEDTGYFGATEATTVTSLRPTSTVPAIRLSDPWGDDEDDDLGREQEISMTFA